MSNYLNIPADSLLGLIYSSNVNITSILFNINSSSAAFGSNKFDNNNLI